MAIRSDGSGETVPKNENIHAGEWRVYGRYFCAPTVDASGTMSERYLHAPHTYEDGEFGDTVMNDVVLRYAPLHMDTLFIEFAQLVENPGMDVADLADAAATSLRTDGLEGVVELPAGLDSERNRKVALSWTKEYGVLGLTPRRKPGSVGGDPRGGEGDTVRRFTYEAWAASATLRLYEAATAPEGPKLDVILRQVPYLEGIRGPETIRKEALESVLRQVQIRLERHSYMQIYKVNGKWERGYRFHSLLGALWLQMSWLFDDNVEERRCKWCGKVIVIEPGEMPRDPGLAKNVRGRYRTRTDKTFCNDPQDKSKSGCRANYYYWYVKKPFKHLKTQSGQRPQ
jgi:hypothetical protein